MTIVTEFGGIVLCGGKSSRMGRPKHLLPFGEEVLLQRVVRIVSQVVSPVVVVAARDQELPSLPNDVLIARDDVKDRGPLGGLAAGLRKMKPYRQAAYVSACDAPLLMPEFITAMLGHLGPADLAILREGKFFHPLAAVYRVELESRVRTFIAEDRLRPFFLVEESHANIVNAEDLRDVDPNLDSLRNTNDPESYRNALRDAGLSSPDHIE